MIATYINFLTILAGGGVGLYLGKKIPPDANDSVLKTISLCVMFIAILGIGGAAGKLVSSDVLIVIISLFLGVVCGEAANIDAWFQRFGDALEKRMKNVRGRVSEGFVAATLIFCVGAMAIVGSLESGLNGKHDTLYAKSVIDGVTATILASSLGAGVLFAAVPVLLYQGAITLTAGVAKPFLTDTAILEMSIAGNILILAIGINMLGTVKIKVANLLPALFFPVAIQTILTLLGPVIAKLH